MWENSTLPCSLNKSHLPVEKQPTKTPNLAAYVGVTPSND